MAAGRGGDEQRAAKLWGYRDPESFGRLLDLLGECVASHLIAQVDAGADAVQIFDSWAAGLPDREFVYAAFKRGNGYLPWFRWCCRVGWTCL